MKSLCVCLLVIMLTSWACAAGNEPVNTLPNSSPDNSSYSRTRTMLQSEIPAIFTRHGLENFVYSGGLHSTSVSCTSTAFATEAFTDQGNRVRASSAGSGGSVAIDYSTVGANCTNPGTDTARVAICALTGNSSGNWQRASGSNYFINAVDTAPTPPADCTPLMDVSIVNGALTVVSDLRHPASLIRTGVYDITDPLYGACSGCSAAINTTALQAVAGATASVYVPIGSFDLNDTITVTNRTFHLHGAGRGLSILVQTGAGKHILTYTTANNTDQLEVDHLSLKAGVAAAGDALHVTYTAVASSSQARVHIHDIEVTAITAGTHYWTNGIVWTDVWNSVISDSWFLLKPPTGQTFNAGAAISLLGMSADALITRNHIYHAQYGVLVQGTTEGTSITDNVIVSADVGISMATAAGEPGKAVSGNNISAFSAGISLAARTDTMVTENLILKHTASTQNFAGISLADIAVGSDNNVITGNFLGDAASAGGTEDGIVCGRCTDTVISNNVCQSMGTCIWLQANGRRNLITGNHQSLGTTTVLVQYTGPLINVLANNTPADSVTALEVNSATPSVGNSPTQNFITNNSNPTTITSLTQGYIGQWLSIRATDANTSLSHLTGNINLRGAKSYLMPNGSTIQLRFDGTIWYEMGPQIPIMGKTGTLNANAAHIVQSSATLSGGSATVDMTNNAIFTSDTSYTCVCTDRTAVAACKIANVTGAQFVITGTGTDVINFICIGN